MLDNSFQARYDKIPIATYINTAQPVTQLTQFMPTHHHQEFEIIVATGGRAEIVINQSRHSVSTGDILLIQPYSVHSGRILPGNAFSHFCFCFDLSLLNEPKLSRLLENGGLEVEQMIHHSCSDINALHGAACRIFRQCVTRERGWDLITRGQLLYLMGLLEHRGSLSSIISSKSHDDFGARVMDILNQTYAADLTSREVAARMSYSQSYFCRLFREHFSVSFQEYLRRFRLCKARLLLAQNQLCVSQVAVRVGFQNLSYFAKSFRDMFGCTPKEFQKIQTRPKDLGMNDADSMPPAYLKEFLETTDRSSEEALPRTPARRRLS